MPDTRYDLSELDIIIPAHNHPELTSKCLRALERSAGDDFHTYFVDNASDPPLEDLFEGYRRKYKTYIRNNANLSFSRANNEAVRRGTGTYILLLNNDCYVEPKCLVFLVDALEDHPDVGIAGAKLLYPVNRRVQHAGVAFYQGIHPFHVGRGVAENDSPANLRGEWPAVTGACLLVRRKLWDLLGGLDENFTPGGYEDTDFCLQARVKGFKVWYEPSAVALHEESATSFASEEYKKRRQEGDMRSFGYFLRKWQANYVDFNDLLPVQRPGLLII